MQSTNYPFDVGDSFVLKTNIGEHLHVIVAEESSDKSATILLVYMSSKNIPSKDRTTEIFVGEHPYITTLSWVRYQNVIICSRDKIPGNVVNYYGKVNKQLFKRIHDGFLISDRVTEYDKTLVRQWRIDKLYKNLH